MELLNQNTKLAYQEWAQQYDTNKNKTRDMEANTLMAVLEYLPFQTCLEIGCGTGKNTEWLLKKGKKVTAVDFSDKMLEKAKDKNKNPNVTFIEADITSQWKFSTKQYDLVIFSLVLEHIQDLEFIFSEASRSLVSGGTIYVGELHPFKQYSGSKARFETENETAMPVCFTHHFSEYIQAASLYGLHLQDVQEYFDNNDKSTIPRILVLLFKKK